MAAKRYGVVIKRWERPRDIGKKMEAELIVVAMILATCVIGIVASALGWHEVARIDQLHREIALAVGDMRCDADAKTVAALLPEWHAKKALARRASLGGETPTSEQSET